MVKTIIGNKGSGKTKKLVDLVIEAVNEANGDVVVIEKDRKLTFDIPYQARLIDAGVYDIGSYEFLKGAICGKPSQPFSPGFAALPRESILTLLSVLPVIRKLHLPF